MKTKLLIFILLFIRFSCVYGQVEESKAAKELEITKFRSHIGYNSATKDSVWNTKNNIHLPSQPTFLSVTVSEKNDTTKLNLIAVLSEEFKLYDTIQMGTNPTLTLFNLTGGIYNLKIVNLSSQHATEIPFSIEPVFWEKWWFSPFVLIVLSILLGLLFYFFYLIRLRQQLQSQSLQHALEIKALRAQMNPHFIFNSMNTIDAYILRKRFIEASDFLQKFSKLIRRILENSEYQTTSIAQEIETLKLYIELEQERFSNSFDYQFKIQTELINQDYQIPPLLIQPFVENAILHGIRHLTERKGLIVLEMSIKNNFLTCMIYDNGIGRLASEEINQQRQANHKSMGINVTMERIRTYQAIYGDTIETKVTDLNEGTAITIQLPLIKN